MIKQAFILAGGKGTRMHPLTLAMPKPLVTMAGRPLMEYLICQLKNFGMNHIILSLGYKGEQVKEYFGNGSRYGVNIDYLIEDEPLGTAGPLLKEESLLDKNFYLANADEFTINPIDKHISTHLGHSDAIATIFLNTVPDITGYGVVELDEKNEKIVKFLEKPKEDETKSRLINSGRYVVSKKILNYIQGKPPISIEREVFPKIAEDEKLYAFIPREPVYWQSVNTIEALQELERHFSKGRLTWPEC